jgi:BolA protein
MARHRMIYAALGEMMDKDIHALSIKAYTPEEI